MPVILWGLISALFNFAVTVAKVEVVFTVTLDVHPTT
jgi:hypothetical protein